MAASKAEAKLDRRKVARGVAHDQHDSIAATERFIDGVERWIAVSKG